MAHTCKDALRKSDVIARYGGEEFIVFLPHTNQKAALEIAEKIRSLVESASVSYHEETVKVTISLGLAFLADTKNLSVETFIDKADKALYKAKNRGRNNVCV